MNVLVSFPVCTLPLSTNISYYDKKKKLGKDDFSSAYYIYLNIFGFHNLTDIPRMDAATPQTS